MGKLFFALLFATMLSGIPYATAASFVRSNNGATIESTYLETALSQGGVIAYLPAHEKLDIYGFEMQAEEDSTIYLSVSSEFISAACLGGDFTVEGSNDSVKIGEVYVHSYSGNHSNSYEFDIERFLGSSSLSINADIRDNLSLKMNSQRQKKFWGLLQASNTNAQAPISPNLEAHRRDYLLLPEIIDLRTEAKGDAEKMARLSAEHFIAAMTNRDNQTIASLLHPAMFNKNGRTPVEWLSLRKRFAYELANSNLPNKIQGATIEEGSMKDGYQIFLKNGEIYHLQTEPMDAMVFVKSIQKM